MNTLLMLPFCISSIGPVSVIAAVVASITGAGLVVVDGRGVVLPLGGLGIVVDLHSTGVAGDSMVSVGDLVRRGPDHW